MVCWPVRFLVKHLISLNLPSWACIALWQVVLIDPILAELFAGCVRHPLSSSAEDGGGRAKICFEAICPLTGDRSVLGLKDMKQHIANHAVEVLCAAIGAQAAPEEAIMEGVE